MLEPPKTFGQLLLRMLVYWQIRGSRPEAENLPGRLGWLLRFNFRAWLSAIVIWLMYVGVWVALLSTPLFRQRPWPQHLLLQIAYSICAPYACYCLAYIALYRVELDEEGLALCQFLYSKKRVLWGDMIGIDYQSEGLQLKIHSKDGTTIDLYLNLNGLSAVRRCLATLTTPEFLTTSWEVADNTLMTEVPGWRCSEQDLTGNPFDPSTRV